MTLEVEMELLDSLGRERAAQYWQRVPPRFALLLAPSAREVGELVNQRIKLCVNSFS
jgi:hypothetical protein